MHCDKTRWDKYSLHPSFKCFLFHKGTHYTLPRKQSNRSWRGTTSERCITSEHGETNTLFILHSTVSYFIQTLTTLYLEHNQIEAEGAKHLSDALRQNTVRQILSSSFIELFLISYRHSLNSTSKAIKSEMKGHNIWVMHYDKTRWDEYSLHPLLNCFWFDKETQYTLRLVEWNRRWRGKTSEWCITTKHGKKNTLFILHSTLSYFIQTLTILDLWNNRIGDKGAQHLSDALRQNTVRQILSSSFIQLFLISYRHSLHSTWKGIESEMKVHNIWVMH